MSKLEIRKGKEVAQGHIAIIGPHEIICADRGTAVPTAQRGQQAVPTSQHLVEHLPHGDALTEEAGRHLSELAGDLCLLASGMFLIPYSSGFGLPPEADRDPLAGSEHPGVQAMEKGRPLAPCCAHYRCTSCFVSHFLCLSAWA